MISVYEQRLVSLSDRVSQLEAKQALHASKLYVFIGTNGPPIFTEKNSSMFYFQTKAKKWQHFLMLCTQN